VAPEGFAASVHEGVCRRRIRLDTHKGKAPVLRLPPGAHLPGAGASRGTLASGPSSAPTAGAKKSSKTGLRPIRWDNTLMSRDHSQTTPHPAGTSPTRGGHPAATPSWGLVNNQRTPAHWNGLGQVELGITGCRAAAGPTTSTSRSPPLPLIRETGDMIPFRHRPAPDQPVGFPENQQPIATIATTAASNRVRTCWFARARTSQGFDSGHPSMVGTLGPVDNQQSRSPHPQALPARAQARFTATVLFAPPALSRCSRRSPADAGDSLALGQLARRRRSVAVARHPALLGLGAARTCTSTIPSTASRALRASGGRFSPAGLVA